MKLSTAFIALATVATASAKKITHSAAQKLVRSARHLDQNQQQDDYSFLGYYDVKVIGCKSQLDSPITNDKGESEYEAVLLRLCPTEAGCDSTYSKGCKSGYGDMLVGLSDFVEAYFEDQRDNMQWDDNFQVDKFAKCEQYNPDENADDNNKGQWENYQFYIGPTCSDDGLEIKLAVFTDEYCTVASEYDFETISNGWSLPYGDGGLVSTQCNSCTAYNNNGEAEIQDMCVQSYENSPLKCEEQMEQYSYYGQDVQGCDTLAAMFPKSEKKGKGGKIFGWILFVVVVVGLAGYVVWWRKKKASTIE